MNTFLIPVDFSPGRLMTTKYAIMLTGGQPTLFHFFHIYPDQLMIPDSSFMDGTAGDAYFNTEVVMEFKKLAEQNMTSFLSEIEKLIQESGEKNIRTTYTVTGGDPEWQIDDICSQIKPELIVMGTRGEGKKGFLEGSMAEKIMSTADIPVFAVPDSVDRISLNNIMYATNFSEKDFQIIQKLVQLFPGSGISLHIVHFELKGKPIGDIRMMEVLQQSLAHGFPDQTINFHLMDSDDKAESLQSFVKNNKIDLIAFIAHKRNLFQDLFSHKIHKRDFFRLELPMLAMHE